MLSSLRSKLLPATLVAAAAGATYSSGLMGNQINSFSSQAAAQTPALDPKDWKSLTLAEKEQLTHNTYRLRFAFASSKQTAGLNVASCLITRAMIKGPGEDEPKMVIRPYTPTSPPDAKGYLDLVIKAYPQGKMSKYLGDLKVGESVDFKGPIPKYPYAANSKKNIGMVAGGTGITPMLQVVDAILSNKDDLTKVSLIYANVSEADIILKEKIDELSAKHPNFKAYYVVDKAKTDKWQGGVGFITQDMLTKILPPPGDDNLVMVCGPPGLMNHISGDKAPDKSQGPLSGLLKKLGYTESQVYKF